MKSILLLRPQGPGEAAPVQPERLISGSPRPSAWNMYTDPTEQFFAGQWAADVGEWQVVYEAHEEEFCVLLEGQVELTDESGHVQHLNAGDAFVVPGGFKGIWKNLSPVRKHYAIMLLSPKDCS